MTQNPTTFALKGAVCFSTDSRHLTCLEDAYLVCQDGRSVGVFPKLPEHFSGIPVRNVSPCLIIPGMTDLHLHAPQYAFHGMYMDLELLDWLNTVTFPEESRYSDPDYAAKAYTIFADDIKKSATTRASVFGTLHVEASELLMDLMEKTGLRTFIGKVNMDRNSSPGLLETTQETITQTRLWLEETKNGIGAIYPILTPRYFPSCTESCLQQLGQLAEEYHVPVQSHLSEGLDEIDWVRELAPDLDFYAQAYDRAGLLGPQTQAVMAHCIFSSPEEVETLKRRNVMVAHCPQSNMNSCGCAAPIMDYLDAGIAVGLGTDVGGGNTLNMFRTIFEAILASKVFWASKNSARNMDQRKVLSLPNAFYLATKGGGVLWKSGSFEPGYCFDAVILDDSRFCDGVQRTPYERMERLITRSDDRDICAKYIDGACVYKKGE